MLNNVFEEDFEPTLEESLAILSGRKQMKKEITEIIEKCANSIILKQKSNSSKDSDGKI